MSRFGSTPTMPRPISFGAVCPISRAATPTPSTIITECSTSTPAIPLFLQPRRRAVLLGGRTADAQADFKKGNELNPKDAYTALWLDLTERRNGVPSSLAETSKQLDMTAWPAPIIRQFRGELTAAQTIAAAADQDLKKKAGSGPAQANFYSGEFALLNKKSKPEATRLLKLAAKDCPLEFVELTASIVEVILNR